MTEYIYATDIMDLRNSVTYWGLAVLVGMVVMVVIICAFIDANIESAIERVMSKNAKSHKKPTIKCECCGEEFEINPQAKYEVIENPPGLNVLTQSATIYECFDCTKCGCQNIVNERKGFPSDVLKKEVTNED